METKRKALGKGLEQLFTNERIDFDHFENNIIQETKSNEIQEIPLDEIRSNPYQPRKVFDEGALQELADSIKEHGVVQPIIVKKSIKGYELVAGERRTKASRLAGKTTIPAIVKEFNDTEMMEIALIENIQRENLNPIEEANAYQAILDSTHMTQEELAKKFGKSRSYITNCLGLLKLPDSTKKYVEEQKISMSHARALSKLEDSKKIEELAKKIMADDINVRDLEEITKEVQEHPKKSVEAVTTKNNRYHIYEDAFSAKVGSRVKIGSKKIEIQFANDYELERILGTLDISIEE